MVPPAELLPENAIKEKKIEPGTLNAAISTYLKSPGHSRTYEHPQTSGLFEKGTCSDILIRAEEIQRLKKRTNEIYVHHTGQPYEVINSTLDRDRFMSAQEALAFGLVDRIETTNYKGSIPSD